LAGGFVLVGEELGGEGLDGAAALFVFGGDVHHEGWADVGEGGGVKDFEGAVGFACDGKLFQAGQEAAFVAERGCVVMIGVAGLPVGEDDCFGTEVADGGGQAKLVLAAGLDIGVGDAQGASPTGAEDFGGFGGFFGAYLGSAASAHFAGGEVEDRSFVAELGHFQHGTAAAEFYVVGMGGDSEYVHVHQEPFLFDLR